MMFKLTCFLVAVLLILCGTAFLRASVEPLKEGDNAVGLMLAGSAGVNFIAAMLLYFAANG